MPSRTLLLVVPLVLLLAGCGGSVTTTVVRSAPGAAGAAASTPNPARAETVTPIAVRSGRLDGGPVTLELLSLHRKAGSTTLTIRLSTTSADELEIHTAFDDGTTTQGEDGMEDIRSFSSLDGIALIDGANRYLVGRAPDGVCYCDNDLGDVVVTRQTPRTLSAVYGAPPPDVRAVDVYIPRFGTFVDVPLS